MITPDGTKITSRRWDLQLEVRSPIGGDTSDWRWDLQLEVTPLIGGEISNWRWHLQLEVTPLIGGGTSDWRCRWDLQLEAPMLHVGISYSFEKKKRLFIVDYIKPSPVYQVKCKLVPFCCYTYSYVVHFFGYYVMADIYNMYGTACT